MTEAPELEAALRIQVQRLDLPVVPVVLPTGWRVGPVAVYLFPHDPVTLIDAGRDGPDTEEGLSRAFRAAGRRVEDLERLIVTHAHTDHYGGARWLQEASGCEVVMHRLEAEDLTRQDEWPELGRALFGPLGLTDELLDAYFGGDRSWPQAPERITPVEGGEVYEAGGVRIRLEHRPGHAPGHLWVVEEHTRAVFGGDYLLSSPTNAGLELDPADPSGRMPLLRLYNEGLAELADLDPPVVFPAHGPPVTEVAELVRRRLEKSRRRTDHVLDVLREAGESTPHELALRMYGERIAGNAWGFLSDVTGRLDFLAAEGRAEARRGEDGFWYFTAKQGGSHG